MIKPCGGTACNGREWRVNAAALPVMRTTYHSVLTVSVQRTSKVRLWTWDDLCWFSFFTRQSEGSHIPIFWRLLCFCRQCTLEPTLEQFNFDDTLRTSIGASHKEDFRTPMKPQRQPAETRCSTRHWGPQRPHKHKDPTF